MNIRFFDRQDSHNPHSGSAVTDANELWSWLDETRGRPPFLCDLVADNGFKLLIGVSETLGCAQYSATDGSPPYLMATTEENNPDADNYMEFLIANTDTPIPLKFCLPMLRIKEVVSDFLATGDKSPRVSWQEI